MQERTPAPDVAPAIAPPAPPGGQLIVQVPGSPGASATAVFEGLKAQRNELRSQLENLEDKRRDLSQRLEEPMVGGADRRGLEQRITEIDQRISATDKQIAESEMQIARAAAVPGAVQPEKPAPREGPPEEVFVLAGMFIFVVLLPLSIAMARRIWRRGVATITSLPAELTERLTRLEQGMDAIAVEVERIGEGQRYMSRLFSEDGSMRAIGAGAAEPVEVKSPEAEARYRR
jgi:prefoldin subunit 5